MNGSEQLELFYTDIRLYHFLAQKMIRACVVYSDSHCLEDLSFAQYFISPTMIIKKNTVRHAHKISVTIFLIIEQLTNVLRTNVSSDKCRRFSQRKVTYSCPQPLYRWLIDMYSGAQSLRPRGANEESSLLVKGHFFVISCSLSM